jgi:predicted nucleic acid-binding protein
MAGPISSVRIYNALLTVAGRSDRESHQYEEDKFCMHTKTRETDEGEYMEIRNRRTRRGKEVDLFDCCTI